MLASGDGVGKGRHVTPPPDLEVESGLRQLSERLKVIVISLLIGALVALATVAFFEIVSAANAFWAVPLPHGLYQIAWDYSVTVGFVLLASALVAGQILLRLDRGQPQGPAELIDCAQNDRIVDLKSGTLSSLLALNSLSGGASVGIFGPLVHLGGCVSAWLQKSSNLLPRGVVLGSGAGAAIAAVFSAPIGAAIFAHEAVIRRFGAFGASPVLACTFAAYWVSSLLLGDHHFFKVGSAPLLNLKSVLVAAVLGVCCGVVSILYIWSVTEVPRLARASRIPLALRPLLPAALLFAISPVLPHLLGAGLDSISLAMAGKLTIGLLLALIFAKVLATTLCLGFGYFGGVFAPALFFGAMLGAIFDGVLAQFGAGGSSYVALGAASCIAAVIGAPVAATVIVFEMTGSYGWAVLSMISVVISVQISRSFVGRSLFDRQLASRGIALQDDYLAKPIA